MPGKANFCPLCRGRWSPFGLSSDQTRKNSSEDVSNLRPRLEKQTRFHFFCNKVFVLVSEPGGGGGDATKEGPFTLSFCWKKVLGRLLLSECLLRYIRTSCLFRWIGVHQLQMVPDISLLRSSLLAIKFFLKQINLSFLRDKCCHLTFCLRLVELNLITVEVLVLTHKAYPNRRCFSIP